MSAAKCSNGMAGVLLREAVAGDDLARRAYQDYCEEAGVACLIPRGTVDRIDRLKSVAGLIEPVRSHWLRVGLSDLSDGRKEPDDDTLRRLLSDVYAVAGMPAKEDER